MSNNESSGRRITREQAPTFLRCPLKLSALSSSCSISSSISSCPSLSLEESPMNTTTISSSALFIGTGTSTGTGAMVSNPAQQTPSNERNNKRTYSSPSRYFSCSSASPACSGGCVHAKRKTFVQADARDYSLSWNVGTDCKFLPRVPLLYELGPVKTTVPAVVSSSPADVADRIATRFRELSLDAVYDDSKAKAFVNSFDGVEFFVRLFQDEVNMNGGFHTGGIVVEIQRKRGCVYRFHLYARSVLRAAASVAASPIVSDASAESETLVSTAIEGAAGVVFGFEKRRSHTLLLRPSLTATSSPCRLKGIHRKLSAPMDRPELDLNVANYTAEHSLEAVDYLLRKDRLDANELGMESLVLLTSEDSSGLDRALHVSRVLVLGDGHDDEKFSGLRKRLASISVQKNEIGGDDDSRRDDCYEHRHNETMRRHAMAALGNALALLARHDADRLKAVLRSGDSWLGADAGSLLPALVSELERAESRPHDACAAARCLAAVLAASSPDVATRIRAKELGVPERLAVAHGVGRCRHAMLARESEAALVLL